jgi:hypothetical protein
MNRTGFVPNAITRLGALFQATIDSVFAPTSASCILAATDDPARGIWLRFVGAWREL